MRREYVALSQSLCDVPELDRPIFAPRRQHPPAVKERGPTRLMEWPLSVARTSPVSTSHSLTVFELPAVRYRPSGEKEK